MIPITSKEFINLLLNFPKKQNFTQVTNKKYEKPSATSKKEFNEYLNIFKN